MALSVDDRVDVCVDPDRDLHGPCAIRAANGDLLLCHQDAEVHLGGDGYTHQWRSTDEGRTWSDEQAVADWRDRGHDALFGEYGLTPDGALVMFVQRRQPRTDNGGILGAWLNRSDDHGRTWTETGPADGSDEHAAMYFRNPFVLDRVMYAGAYGRRGHYLYVSDDDGRTWQRRSLMFSADHPGFETIGTAGPPFYPHVEPCPDGSLLALTYHTATNRCYSRRSADEGFSWTEVEPLPGLPVWAPRLRRLDASTMMVTGRDIGVKSTVAWLSADSGRTWEDRSVLDTPAFEGSYAYTDSIVDDGGIWVFTSSPQSEGRGDIIGLRCRLQ